MPLATVRPDSWNFPLFVHVLGAMLLVGTLLTVVIVMVVSWGSGTAGAMLTRVGFKTLLFATIPSWLLMRIGGEWIYSKEPYNGDNDPGWLGVGYTTADLGVILLVIVTVIAGVAVRRTRRRPEGVSALGRVALVLTAVLLGAYLVALWAMTTKPS